MRKPKIRVVFQGGGARVTTLLAAAEALEELEDQFTVDRVIGTSAGAIAACVYASPESVKSHISTMLAVGAATIKNFELGPNFPIIGRPWLTSKVLAGHSVFDEKHVMKFFDEVLVDSDGQTIKKMRFPTCIVASDLENREKVTHDVTESSDLSRCLMDSCAFPIAFRNTRQQNPMVDGGLCANLPVDDALLRDEEIHTLVFAFQKGNVERGTARGLVEFTKSMFSTAIDASVEAACLRAEENGGHVIRLPNQFDTFEFSAALSNGLHGSLFNHARDYSRSEIINALNKFRSENIRTSRTIKSEHVGDKLLRIVRQQAEIGGTSVLRDTCIVFANCLQPGNPKEDEIVQFYECSFSAETLSFLKLPIHSSIESSAAVKTVNIEDANGDELDFEDFIVSGSDEYGQPKHSVLIIFSSPIKKAKVPIRISYSVKIRSGCEDLSTSGYTWLRFKNNGGCQVEKCENILMVPKGFGGVEPRDMSQRRERYSENKSLGDYETSTRRWVEGREIGKKALGELLDRYFAKYPYRHDYNAYGWEALNLERDQHCGAFFEKIR